eukprot:TRINITY_DN4513_c1_g2_i2.p1 TRINITY_DN4513_c1_g2~~TRINITY_DN4513_c1_g2_i2.p1  ORF type:complete len:426 (+),score=84.25 TRINITY_DN4513_c1_g2_i2:93-1280(+)
MLELCAQWALSLTNAFGTWTYHDCGSQRAASAAVQFLQLVIFLVLRPYRCLRDDITKFATQACLTVALASLSVTFFREAERLDGGAAEHPGPNVSTAVLLLKIATYVVLSQVTLRVLAEVVLLVWGWRAHSQKLEWAEAEAGALMSSQAELPMLHFESGLAQDVPDDPPGPVMGASTSTLPVFDPPDAPRSPVGWVEGKGDPARADSPLPGERRPSGTPGFEAAARGVAAGRGFRPAALVGLAAARRSSPTAGEPRTPVSASGRRPTLTSPPSPASTVGTQLQQHLVSPLRVRRRTPSRRRGTLPPSGVSPALHRGGAPRSPTADPITPRSKPRAASQPDALQPLQPAAPQEEAEPPARPAGSTDPAGPRRDRSVSHGARRARGGSGKGDGLVWF